MDIRKENISNEQYEEEKKAIDQISIKLDEYKAGIIIAERKNSYLNFGMFGNSIDLLFLMEELFRRLPQNLKKGALEILNEDENAESNSLEAQAPAHNRIYN